MNEEQKQQIYVFVTQNLNRQNIPVPMRDYLFHLIAAADEAIRREGITPDYETESDKHLCEEYACYLYRKRATGDKMPDSLRWNLNQRHFGRIV